MIINGKEIAEEVLRKLQGTSAPMRLGVVMAGEDPVVASFVKLKSRVAERLGVDMVREELPEGAVTEDAIAAVKRLAERTGGIIVQLPLPGEIDTDAVLAAIPKTHDLDAVSPGKHVVEAPVARAVEEILAQAHVDVGGKQAAVVGAGRLVGAPVAELLQRLGARVEVITEREGTLARLKEADIVVSGAGEPGLIKPAMLKEGVVLIDAGTSDLSASGGAGSKIVGDADPACAEVASVFTPVPGGVGPIAVAMIFENLFELAHKGRAL